MKKNMKHIRGIQIAIPVLILMWATIGVCFSTTYYVDISVTDTHMASATPDFTTYNHTTFATTGGRDRVFKTIADINSFSALAAGDSVLFRKGQTWREQLTIPASGSSGNPITFGAYGSGAQPLISGEGPTANRAYCIKVNVRTYITINDLHTERAIGAYAENIYILNSSYVNVQNCESEYSAHSGIKILDSPYCVIRNCVTHHNYNTGIFAKQSNNILITNCISHHNDYKGIDIEAEQDNEILNATVEVCTSHDNKREGIDTDNADGVTVRRCNVYLNGSLSPDFPGISIGNGTQDATISYCIIHHNFNEGITIEQSGENTGTKIYNDVFYGNGANNIYIKSNSTTIRNCVSMNAGNSLFTVPSGLGIMYTNSDYNIFYDDTDFKMVWNGTIYNNLIAFCTASSQEANSKENDPHFIGASNDDFRVQYNSVVIDAGTDVGLIEDYIGNPVPFSTRPDMGAYEWQGTLVDGNLIPLITKLNQNYPNPFNPTTTIEFSIQNDSHIELTVRNIKGQKIKSLLNDQITAGEHSIAWDGKDAFGKKVSSGVYLYKLSVNGKIEAVRKCLLLK